MTTTLQAPPELMAGIDPIPDAVQELGDLRDGDGTRRLIASRDLHGGLLVIDEDQRGNDRRLVARPGHPAEYRAAERPRRRLPVLEPEQL